MNEFRNINLNKYKIVSFDIFDTVILRYFAEPSDVFEALSRKDEVLKIVGNFKDVRIQAESSARNKVWNSKKLTEVTLDEIYDELKLTLKIDDEEVQLLKQMEIDFEIHTCTRNEYIYSFYQKCLQQNVRVVFTSDMYLSLEVIKNILESNGYTSYEEIYLSSELKKTKSTSELFKHMISSTGVSANEVLHIGDNYHSDVEMAKNCGIDSIYYQKTSEYFSANNRTIPKDLSNNLEFSMMLGLINKKLYANRSNQAASFWYRFGYQYVGILYYGFTEWLFNHVNNKFNKVYFLSRDGYIMKKAFDLVANQTTIKSHYMYASRRALNIAAITKLDQNTMDFLKSGTSRLKVADFVKRIGVNPQDVINEIREVGFNDIHDFIITGTDYYKLEQLFYYINQKIKKVAKEERDLLLKYLEQIDFVGKEDEHIAIVDIGWHGSLQLSLQNLLNIISNKNKITGFYLGTFEKAKNISDKGIKIESYLCHLGKPVENEKAIKTCVEIFELLYSAPHGSVIKFTKSNNGTIEPVLDKQEKDENKIMIVNEIQQAALDFVQDFVNLKTKLSISTNVTPEVSLAQLNNLLQSPTKEEAIKLGDIVHAEGFGDVYSRRYIAKPPSPLTILSPKKYIQSYKNAFWREGFERRLPNFYVNLGNLVRKYKAKKNSNKG
ncbi:HAD family hydrolase [Paenibacillus chartarius]|uniref:HAD family hydrolase n=1 Tax=Paenibacillus chartarius TaxID=747481 RepID=A0ABV6DKW3_9BACL